MSTNLTRRRLAICGKCGYRDGDRCQLLADWMSLESVAHITRNRCPVGSWTILNPTTEALAWPESLPTDFADSILQDHSE